MSSDKRKFADYKSFPGRIHENTYEFPTLFTTDKSGKCKVWTIYVRLIKKSSKKSFKNINWDLTSENQVPIKAEYLNDDCFVPNGIISEIWTEYGLSGEDKITRSAPTYPNPKHTGTSGKPKPANYRDYFKQALVSARGIYLKKIDAGGVPESEYGKKSLVTNTKYFPMLAKKEKEYVRIHKLKWPLYVQPKLDGLRNLVYLTKSNKPDISNVIMYTRRKKDYSYNDYNNNIRKELLPILVEYFGKYKENESIYLDGEIYNHNMKLQEINHYARMSATDKSSETNSAETSADEANADKTNADEAKIQYWIYDVFYPSQKLTFKERAAILDELNKKLSKAKYVKITETLLIKNSADLDEQYKKYIENNYEGMMIRSADGIYATSSKNSNLRSSDLLKRKEVFTDEYEVVGWTQGTAGKEVGAIIWICQTPDGKRFNVTPNYDFSERYRIYKECQKHFDDKYANRLLTVEYRSKSEDGIPQHAKGIMFRDVE